MRQVTLEDKETDEIILATHGMGWPYYQGQTFLLFLKNTSEFLGTDILMYTLSPPDTYPFFHK